MARTSSRSSPVRSSRSNNRWDGVTYNVYADPQGTDRPWALDPLPFVLPAAEWQTIETGVKQRARLLNAVLTLLHAAIAGA